MIQQKMIGKNRPKNIFNVINTTWPRYWTTGANAVPSSGLKFINVAEQLSAALFCLSHDSRSESDQPVPFPATKFGATTDLAVP